MSVFQIIIVFQTAEPILMKFRMKTRLNPRGKIDLLYNNNNLVQYIV